MKSMKIMSLLAIMAVMEEGYMDGTSSKRKLKELTEEEREQVKKLKEEKEISRKLKCGLKPYEYEGKIIWALNEKNAIRKINKFTN